MVGSQPLTPPSTPGANKNDGLLEGTRGLALGNIVQQVVAGHKRFPQITDANRIDEQLDAKDKIIRRLNFPDFNPVNEEDFEDWIDKVATQVRAERLCARLFAEVWQSKARLAVGNILSMVDWDGIHHEELVDSVALTLFPASRYHIRLESQLFGGVRQPTVVDARYHVQETTARYLRLCQRRGYDIAITDSRIIEYIYASFPSRVENELRREGVIKSWHGVLDKAAAIEQEFNRLGITQTEPLGVLTAEKEDGEIMDEPMPQGKQERRHPGIRQPNKCMGCGAEKDHFYKDCRFKNSRCKECHLLGHISTVCPNKVLKDTQGRVQTLFKPTPGGVNLQHRADRTQRDRVDTASDIIRKLQEWATRKSEKSAKARERKKEETGWKPKRKKVDHPVHIAEKEETDSSEDSEDELLRILKAFPADGSEKLSFEVEAEVNGQKRVVLMDSGAQKSICNEKVAGELKLVVTERTASFKGLGRARARLAEPVKLRIGTREASVVFHVCENLEIPLLIGLEELSALNVALGARTRRVYDEKTFEVIAVAWPDHIPEEEMRSVDFVDLTDNKGTDEQRIKSGQMVLQGLTSHLEDDDKRAIWEVFLKNLACWLRPKSGGVTRFEVSFKVSGRPIKQPLRRLAEPLQEELNQQLDAMLEANVIVPSKSAWGSCPVFVKKKGGKWRMCLDYRQLNKMMKADAYPVPLLLERLQQVAHARWYASIDLQWAYWNIKIQEESRQYTAFVTSKGSFEFTVLPFGIKNSPAEFQRIMDSIFGDLYTNGVSIYFDDIVIFADTKARLLERLDIVLGRCCDEGLNVKLGKSELMKTEISMLGHIVGRNGIYSDPKKVVAVQEARAPKNRDELRSLLGTVGYLRRFIPHFAELVFPLTELTKKGTRYEWDTACQKAFDTLKEELATVVLLSSPKGTGPFIIVTDASSVGIGNALLQVQDGDLVLIEFGSKKLTLAEQKWDTREREAFAIKWSVKQYEDYVKAGKVFVLTDHESLKWMDGATTGRVQRWALYLQQFDLEVIHVAGMVNVMADWLSRCCQGEDCDQINEICVPAFGITFAEDNSRPDHLICPRIPRPEDFKRAYQTLSEEEKRDLHEGQDGFFYSVKCGKLYIPQELREEILFWFHTSRYGGHSGINRTLRRMRQFVWWRGMHQSVGDYVANCLPCKRHRPPVQQKTFRGVLTKPQPLQMLSLDFVGPRVWGSRKVHFIVGIDHASRFVLAKSADGPTARAAIQFLKECWLPVFQAPEAILVDRGSSFTSAEFRKFITTKVGAYVVYTSPYYPQGNAINESCHRAIETSIKAVDNDMLVTFEEALADSVTVHNATPHPATGESPFCFLFGSEPALPGWQPYMWTNEDDVRRSKQREIRLKALIRAKVAKELELKGIGTAKVAIGDWVVFVYSDYEQSKKSRGTDALTAGNKYSPSWSLPAKVVRISDKVCHVTELGRDIEPRQVPMTQITKLEGPVPPTLARLNIAHIQKDNPRFVRARVIQQALSGQPSTWDDIVREATLGVKKRARTNSETGKKGAGETQGGD